MVCICCLTQAKFCHMLISRWFERKATNGLEKTTDGRKDSNDYQELGLLRKGLFQVNTILTFYQNY